MLQKPSTISTFNLKILNKTQSNIENLTINNIKPESLTTNIHLPKKCLLKNCKICSKFISSNFIKLNNFFLPLDVNCNTMNAGYAINCSLCPKVINDKWKRKKGERKKNL